jgi:hypothetical protein
MDIGEEFVNLEMSVEQIFNVEVKAKESVCTWGDQIFLVVNVSADMVGMEKAVLTRTVVKNCHDQLIVSILLLMPFKS